jgi:MYXO-CTERM domain-containing protein
MKNLSTLFAVTLGAALALGTPIARADQADKDACIGLAEGDDCTRGNGAPGTCSPDASDPSVLTCDDDASGTADSGGDSSGCSTSRGSPDPLAILLLGVGLAWSRRRAAR